MPGHRCVRPRECRAGRRSPKARAALRLKSGHRIGTQFAAVETEPVAVASGHVRTLSPSKKPSASRLERLARRRRRRRSRRAGTPGPRHGRARSGALPLHACRQAPPERWKSPRRPGSSCIAATRRRSRPVKPRDLGGQHRRFDRLRQIPLHLGDQLTETRRSLRPTRSAPAPESGRRDRRRATGPCRQAHTSRAPATRAVADQHVGPPGFERFERVGDRRRRLHHGAALLQHGPQQLARLGILVEDQHAQPVERRRRIGAPAAGTRPWRLWPEQLGRLQRKARREDRARSHPRDCAPRFRRRAARRVPDERQPDAEAAGGACRRRVRLREAVEDARQEVRIDPGRCRVRPSAAPRCPRSRPTASTAAAARRELDRVREQMPGDLAQARSASPSTADRRVGNATFDAHALGRRRRLDRRHRLPRGFAERGRLATRAAVAGQRLRHVEQVAGQLRLQLDVALDRFEAAARRRRDRACRCAAGAPSRGRRSAACVARAKPSRGTRPSSGWRPRLRGAPPARRAPAPPQARRAARNSDTRAVSSSPCTRKSARWMRDDRARYSAAAGSKVPSTAPSTVAASAGPVPANHALASTAIPSSRNLPRVVDRSAGERVHHEDHRHRGKRNRKAQRRRKGRKRIGVWRAIMNSLGCIGETHVSTRSTTAVATAVPLADQLRGDVGSLAFSCGDRRCVDRSPSVGADGVRRLQRLRRDCLDRPENLVDQPVFWALNASR